MEEISGPYYCDEEGNVVDLEKLTDPNYDPYITFDYVRFEGFSGTYESAYIYHPGSETYWELIDGYHSLIRRQEIDPSKICSKILDEVFNRELEVY